MANENQIVIRKEYFDNINTVITSINSFFSSNFKNKNFPVVDETFQTDTVVMEIISWLNNVEPSWIDNYDKIEEVLNGIIEATKDIEDEDKFTYLVNNNNTVILDHINAFIGYKVLQFIGNNFEDFNTLINGIYSFELFTKPSQYKECIDIFSQDIPLTELDSVLGDNKYVLFSDEKYISGIFSNPQINLPETFKLDTELSRFNNGTDLTNIEILVDDSVQEAVVTNAFADKKPEHIKYNESDDTFKLSKQYKSAVDSFISDIKKCDTTEDLAKFFSDEKIGKKDYASLFAHNVMPFILAKVFNNTTKYPFDTYDVDEVGKYIKSYKSIVDKNNGAKRFINYDMFSTFKIDKESTINFLSSFLKLELYNNKSEVISNNILLILFNIFDSRIYLNTLYNLIPDKVKKDKYQTSDIFVKAVRAKINEHSRVANVYKPDTDTGNNTTTEVLEYTDIMMKQMGDMSTTDMAYCEQYRGLVMSEIDCVGDVLYNMNLSPIKIDKYIGESYIQEVETGDIPSYMRDRINLSDSTGTSPGVSIADMQLPPDVPMNPYEDLTMSIDTKLSNSDSLDNSLGIGYHDTTKKSDGKIVYNITNNYTNSFNRDNSRHDSSTGKTITITNTNSHNDTSTNKRSNINTGKAPNNNMRKNSLNNYNNGIVSPDDSKDDRDDITIEHLTLSSGYSVQEVMVFLESEEPPSDGANDAGKPPKSDLLTASMDVDRKTLSAQQGAKKKVQKAVNTAKAVMKPVTRTKKWLTGILDSLIKRDENKVKAEIIENPSYRTALYKAGRLAIKLGLTGIAFTINSYLGAAYVAINVAKVADKERLKKEVQEEFTAELEILDDKIERASREDSPESRKALWQMMRLRSKLQKHALDAPKSRIKHYRGIY